MTSDPSYLDAQSQVQGTVQRVNFRQWTRKTAQASNITGWIRNHDAGHVEGEALGQAQDMDNFKVHLHRGPKRAQVSQVIITGEKVVQNPEDIGWTLTDFEVRE
ncbi:SubName: Full=Uncharacterized protein {ECO:0000313/EMBL:CCA68452.1} [Serendipita indica DSM 11827]|nr:SubName: Full=Uncharacterized protein {ECO:0000313/EMBL:CCA68452.1} [Serendipita indica DSM 11827]